MKSLVSLVFFTIITIGSSFAQEGNKPNIVFIFSDDHAVNAISAYGGPLAKVAPTPNIDRLAKEGALFTNAFCTNSICSPSRACVLTGQYNHVNGAFDLSGRVEPGKQMLAIQMRSAGYQTAMIGKWHLGWNWPLKEGGTANDQGDFSGKFKGGWDVDYEADIQNGPCDLGFDYFFGISASLDMPPYVYVRNRRPTEPATVEKAFNRKGPAAASFEAVDVLPTITQESVQFINKHAKDDAPFFLYFPLNAPHTPIVPTEEWKGKSGINKYGDFTMQVDWTVGQILKALDDKGIADNTLVVFTTDNGCSPAAKIPELEAAGHDQNYIFRGHKADIFEGGHRVPFIARWPTTVKAGTRSDQIVGQLDLMATAADITGATVPAQAGEDSVSFLPVLKGEATSPIRTSIVSQSIGGQFAIRDGQWKLCLCPGSGGWSNPRPGRVDMSDMPLVQLYDLSKDPGEQNNLEAKHPDRVEKMKKMLSTIIDNGRSFTGPKTANDADIVMIKPVAAKRGK